MCCKPPSTVPSNAHPNHNAYCLTGANSNVGRENSRCQHPSLGWFKINTDGSSDLSLGHTTCGGVSRDSTGNWIFEFYKYIGICTTLEAEIWGLYVGVMCALKRGVQKVIIESNCSQAINLLLAGKSDQVTAPIIRHICDFTKELEGVCFQHVKRGCNTVTDRLCKLACSSKFEVHLVEYPTEELKTLLDADVFGPVVG
ncbi:hypothetical protein V6N11_076651 [Hibiscus sabdariffa]|uniref:Uncharacterized protein n=2 Tax=Hibiscus sabdariffa TaxID=183260 RepID=A0ABR2DYE6_9ROSI